MVELDVFDPEKVGSADYEGRKAVLFVGLEEIEDNNTIVCRLFNYKGEHLDHGILFYLTENGLTRADGVGKDYGFELEADGKIKIVNDE